MRRTRLKSISPKKAKANALYAKSKKELWNDLCEAQGRNKKDGPMCERCGEMLATDPHHKAQRRSVLLWHKPMLSWLCRPCHNAIHANPSQARKDGWLIDISRDELYLIELEEKPKLWEK